MLSKPYADRPIGHKSGLLGGAGFDDDDLLSSPEFNESQQNDDNLQCSRRKSKHLLASGIEYVPLKNRKWAVSTLGYFTKNKMHYIWETAMD